MSDDFVPVTTPVLIRPRASVEIETMTKGLPKVTVRVDHDNADAAADEALRVYTATVARLQAWSNEG